MKIASKVLKIMILSLSACFMFFGCASLKKTRQEQTTFKSEIQKRDSIKSVVISKAIKDSLITPIVQSSTGNVVFDSLVNAKVDEILSKLNTSKSSGDNGYRLLYDKFKKQLEFYAKVAQSQDEKTAVKEQNQKIVIQEKKIPVVTEKPLAKWQKILMGLGVLLLLILGIRIAVFVTKKSML